MVCECGHDEHEWTEPQVCKTIDCKCSQFKEVTELTPVISQIDKYFANFEKFYDKMEWMLNNLRFFRNYTNKDLVFAWWQYVNHWDRKKTLSDSQYYELDDPETITRVRRKLVEKFPEKYGVFNPTTEEQKVFKQFAIEEWVRTK